MRTRTNGNNNAPRANNATSNVRRTNAPASQASDRKSGFREVGTIFERKDGSGFFLKVNEDVTLKAGQTLNLETPQSKIERLLAFGYLSEEAADARLANLPKTIKFDVILPPAKEE